MSDTPRTDAVVNKSVKNDNSKFLTEDLHFHARELERENKKLLEKISLLKTDYLALENEHFAELGKLKRENARLRECAAAKAEQEGVSG